MALLLSLPGLTHPAPSHILCTQVCADAQFLASWNLMDYSLLLGIHHVTEHRVLREEGPRGLLTRRASLTSTPHSVVVAPRDTVTRDTRSGALADGVSERGEA